MELSRIKALRGPNLWTKRTAVEAHVVCPPEQCNIAGLTGFYARLRERFPEIGVLVADGNETTLSLAHVLEHATLALQLQAGCKVTFSDTIATADAGTYIVVAEYTEEAVGKLAIELAQQLCHAALNSIEFDIHAALHQLRDLDENIRLGPSTGAIVDAAVKLGIPYRRLTEGSMVQFGWGSKQRRILAAETDRTSAIAESIAQDKDLTKMLLEAAGVPVPNGMVVETAEAAWQAAQEIAAPVVIKPLDGNQGKGVAVNISTEAQVKTAFEVAARISSEVIVERYLPGHDFRLLVINNKLVAAARRDPPQVIGDGKRTVRELIDLVNKDPLRGDGHATSLTKIRLDDIALATLAKYSYTADSVPPKGALVVLRNNANLSTGGTATDVTDDVHPELAARAITAAQMVGLDICGVDMVCQTVVKPLEEQGGGIVEVNAAPGLRMHLAPSYGKSRPVGEAIVSMMFPDGGNARVPVVTVTGTNGKTTTIRLISHLLTHQGLRVGMTNSDGVYIQGRRIDAGDCSGPRSARNVLLHPDVDAAVLETARGGVLREGLGFDRCNVAVVTNLGIGDHLGLNHIHTVEDLAKVKRVVVENVAQNGFAVLNAADPLVAKMADACPGGVIFFSVDPNNLVLATHKAQGRRVVYRDGDAIIAAEGKAQRRFLLSQIPLTRNGQILFQVENAMAAIAAVWGLNVPWQVVSEGLTSFVSDAQTAPGRFNLFEYRGATLIADYGHNPDAIAALVNSIHNMPAKKRVAVISGAGDRRDEDITEQTKILSSSFDHVILYEDQCQRGRSEGEVVALLRAGLEGATRTRTVHEIKGEFNAIDLALKHLETGDLCLVLIDQVDESLGYIAAKCV